MKENNKTIEIKAYNFNDILRYSLIAIGISSLIMLFSYPLSKYIHSLWFAILAIGLPYSYFIEKIKKLKNNIDFNGEIINIDNEIIKLPEISDYRIFNSLRLFFGLRICLKNNRKFFFYIPVMYKDNLLDYFDRKKMITKKK